jgi:hypothetical protein
VPSLPEFGEESIYETEIRTGCTPLDLKDALRCAVIRDDHVYFQRFTKHKDEDLVGGKGAIPEAGEDSPETGL